MLHRSLCSVVCVSLLFGCGGSDDSSSAGSGGGSSQDGGGDPDAMGSESGAPDGAGSDATASDGGSSDASVCNGVVCNTPPADVCENATELRTYASTGTCSSSAECEYASSLTTCATGCAGGACSQCKLGAFKLESFIGSVGSASLGVADSGILHAVYSLSPSYSINYRRRAPGGAWTVQTLPPTGTSVFPYLYVEPSGSVHLPHEPPFGQTIDLVHSVLAPGGAWVNTAVGAATGGAIRPRGSSIAVDSKGTVHMLVDTTPTTGVPAAVRYARRPAGGAWTLTTLDTYPDSTNVNVALAVDANDGLHGIYGLGSNGVVRYAYQPAGGAWKKQDLAATASTEPVRVAIATDAKGGAHALYNDPVSLNVRYAYKPAAGTFTQSNLSTGNTTVISTKIAIGSDGSLHALYGELQSGASGFRLRYSTKQGSAAWNSQLIDDKAGYSTGSGASLVIGVDDSVHIMYTQSHVVAGKLAGEIKYGQRSCQ